MSTVRHSDVQLWRGSRTGKGLYRPTFPSKSFIPSGALLYAPSCTCLLALLIPVITSYF